MESVEQITFDLRYRKSRTAFFTVWPWIPAGDRDRLLILMRERFTVQDHRRPALLDKNLIGYCTLEEIYLSARLILGPWSDRRQALLEHTILHELAHLYHLHPVDRSKCSAFKEYEAEQRARSWGSRYKSPFLEEVIVCGGQFLAVRAGVKRLIRQIKKKYQGDPDSIAWLIARLGDRGQPASLPNCPAKFRKAAPKGAEP